MRCEVTQFAVAATNHIALSSDVIRSGEMTDTNAPVQLWLFLRTLATTSV